MMSDHLSVQFCVRLRSISSNRVLLSGVPLNQSCKGMSHPAGGGVGYLRSEEVSVVSELMSAVIPAQLQLSNPNPWKPGQLFLKPDQENQSCSAEDRYVEMFPERIRRNRITERKENKVSDRKNENSRCEQKAVHQQSQTIKGSLNWSWGVNAFRPPVWSESCQRFTNRLTSLSFHGGGFCLNFSEKCGEEKVSEETVENQKGSVSFGFKWSHSTKGSPE